MHHGGDKGHAYTHFGDCKVEAAKNHLAVFAHQFEVQGGLEHDHDEPNAAQNLENRLHVGNPALQRTLTQGAHGKSHPEEHEYTRDSSGPRQYVKEVAHDDDERQRDEYRGG